MAGQSLGSRILPRGWHDRLQVERYPIHVFVRQRFLPHLAPGMTVLDVGSGRLPDEQLHRTELLSTGATLETLDFLPGEGVDHVADAADTKLPSQHYDALFCMQVLEHVPDPQAVCRELFRMAKPGAYVSVSAPQSSPLHNLPYHYFHYTNIGMRKMLEDAGFEVVLMEAQGGHFNTLASMHHYTCMAMDQLMAQRGNPLWYKPVRLLMRLWNGFIMKAVYIRLDSAFFWEGSTQGWSVLCRRPL